MFAFTIGPLEIFYSTLPLTVFYAKDILRNEKSYKDLQFTALKFKHIEESSTEVGSHIVVNTLHH